ncbi:thioredoxin family protein [Limnobacter humi]|uniref:Thioredoxin family protein n=1 Tax=Limnobacter humi TaxID=1778671 RepID=A0ABT1WDP0_9BURK|nr:thioredoxin family protein [Limnobacter humi]MCQ8895610.1 thioredoxin family protein [Limnobacter humi]
MALKIQLLCAEWCGVCRTFKADYQQLCSSHPEWQWQWLDIEDDEDACAGVDVENLPTLRVFKQQGLHSIEVFAGPVRPDIRVIEHMLLHFQQT